MKRWLGVTAFLLWSTAAAAQEPDLAVRLYWLQLLDSAKVTPQGDLRVRTCRACDWEQVAQPIPLQISQGHLQMEDRRSPDGFAELAGNWRLEVPGHPAVSAARRLTVTLERGRLLLTVRMPLGEYVAAVLAGESSNFRSDESLKAMAVAVRTYAVHYRGRHKAEGFDLCDTTHCQDVRLGGMQERLRAAAEATAGEMLWFAGAPAATYYHRHCGGTTENSDRVWPTSKLPYLRQHSDSYCVTRGRAEWNSAIPLDALEQALRTAGLRVPSPLRAIEITARSGSGRVTQLRLTGSAAQAVTAEEFRLAVGRGLGWQHLRSDLYEVRLAGNQAVFNGFGAGHGVGLCQAGAARMGELGKGYQEILAYYYPGTTVGLTAQGIAWQAMAGERVEVITTRPQQDGLALALAERLLRESEQATGWPLAVRPQLKIYPSLETYRNATGSPGWVAASARGRVIRLQPVEVLRGSGKLESTLRHELLHLLVESRARRPLPLWFREGLVLALSGERLPATIRSLPAAAEVERALVSAQSEQELRSAYGLAQALVETLIGRHGREEVLRWVEQGLPNVLFGAGRR